MTTATAEAIQDARAAAIDLPAAREAQVEAEATAERLRVRVAAGDDLKANGVRYGDALEEAAGARRKVSELIATINSREIHVHQESEDAALERATKAHRRQRLAAAATVGNLKSFFGSLSNLMAVEDVLNSARGEHLRHRRQLRTLGAHVDEEAIIPETVMTAVAVLEALGTVLRTPPSMRAAKLAELLGGDS